MEIGGSLGGLEIRRAGGGATRLRGSFPYGKLATLSDGGRGGGRPKKEQFAPRAFGFNVEREDVDISFLYGHDFGKPLASRKSGTLVLRDTEAELSFEATITPEIKEASWVRDFLAAFGAGLVLGLSPGFRLPPPRAVKDAEKIEEEDPSEGDALIRTIYAALLFEVSAVTRAAYQEAAISERAWEATVRQRGRADLVHHLNRWRL